MVEELHGAKSYLWVALVGAEMVGKEVLGVGQGPAVVASCGGGWRARAAGVSEGTCGGRRRVSS